MWPWMAPRCIHRHQEFLSFLRRIDKEVPKDVKLYLIFDNNFTHKYAK